jgi:hypothetical protein
MSLGASYCAALPTAGCENARRFFAIETKTWRVLKLLKVSGYVEAASGLLRGGLSP